MGVGGKKRKMELFFVDTEHALRSPNLTAAKLAVIRFVVD